MGNKKELIKSTSVRKDFSYAIGNISLRFTLDITSKTELSTFKQLLEAGLSDVEKAITDLINAD